MTFGEKLRQSRREKGMSTAFFAGKAGVCTSIMYKYELDVQQPTLKRFRKMCEVLDMTPSKFLEGVDI